MSSTRKTLKPGVISKSQRHYIYGQGHDEINLCINASGRYYFTKLKNGEYDSYQPSDDELDDILRQYNQINDPSKPRLTGPLYSPAPPAASHSRFFWRRRSNPVFSSVADTIVGHLNARHIEGVSITVDADRNQSGQKVVKLTLNKSDACKLRDGYKLGAKTVIKEDPQDTNKVTMVLGPRRAQALFNNMDIPKYGQETMFDALVRDFGQQSQSRPASSYRG